MASDIWLVSRLHDMSGREQMPLSIPLLVFVLLYGLSCILPSSSWGVLAIYFCPMWMLEELLKLKLQ